MVRSVIQDIRFALRQLSKNPGFALTAVLTLAIGIGANTAVFSAIEAVLFRTLPYGDPSRLALLTDLQDPQDGGILLKDFDTLKQQSHSLQDTAVFYRDSGWSNVTLTGTVRPQQVQAGFVSGNFFSVLGVSPIVGRSFTDQEVNRRERVAVLSYSFWRSQFGGSQGVVGKIFEVNGQPTEVIGVMPKTFQFPASDVQFWSPITTNTNWQDPALSVPGHTRGFYARWQAVARLQPTISLATAQSEINTLFDRLNTADPDPNRGTGIKAQAFAVHLSSASRLELFLLFGAVCLLLVISCANVANLLLSRAAARSGEIALRTALGAERGRIVRQLLTESMVLAVLGAILSLPIAFFSIRALLTFHTGNIPRLNQAGLNPVVLIFTLTVSLLSSVAVGLAPALKMFRSDPNLAMKGSAHNATDSQPVARIRGLVIVSEFALSVLLLTGAGLLLRSFLTVMAVDPGFEPEHVLHLTLNFPSGTTSQQEDAMYQASLERIKSYPGMKFTGAVDELFEPGGANNLGLREVEGRTSEPRKEWTALTWNTVRGDYFQAMGIPLLQGRYFSESDGPASPPVAIIDESTAKRYWPNQDPVNKRFKGQDPRGTHDDWVTVIGVVRDVHSHGLEKQPTAHIYQWYRQSEDSTHDLVVRIQGNPGTVVGSLRSIVQAQEPTAIISDVQTLRQELSEQVAPRRAITFLISVFAVVALLLAAIGIYGLMHYTVIQRTQEIGVRMALGANRADVLNLFLRQGMRLTFIGIAVGFAFDWLLTGILKSLLFGVAATDPFTLAGVVVILSAISAAATILPAWRASKVDPLDALRAE